MNHEIKLKRIFFCRPKSIDDGTVFVIYPQISARQLSRTILKSFFSIIDYSVLTFFSFFLKSGVNKKIIEKKNGKLATEKNFKTEPAVILRKPFVSE